MLDECRKISSDRLEEERDISADISFKLGNYLVDRENNIADAISAYNECLNKKEDHIDSMVALAKIY